MLDTNSRWYQRGWSDGWHYYAPDHDLYVAGKRVGTMTKEEAALYDAGYKAGKGKVNGARLTALGY